MLRRAFLRRMAGAAMGIGMLGSELLRRTPQLLPEVPFTVGKTYTIEEVGSDGQMVVYQGMRVTNIRIGPDTPGGVVTEINFESDFTRHGGSITIEHQT